MFFFKRHTEKVDLGWLQTDIHSHLIPGIDDGARDLSDSLELIKGLYELGFAKLITTPHILAEVYPNTPERILGGRDDVRKALKEAGLSFTLDAAAEYFIDDQFENNLKEKKPLLTLTGNFVLVEFSMLSAPMELQESLFEMQMQGYQPIIAHPERYTYLARKKEVFDSLKHSGCLFQLNLMSLTGHYGSSVLELAEYLLKKDYYDYAGTDLHSKKHLAVLQKLSASASYRKLEKSGRLKNPSL